MKTNDRSIWCRIFALPLLGILMLMSSPSSAEQSATAFTYQGRLSDGASAANGLYDLQFSIYDAASSGSAVGGPLTVSSVRVADGLFVVTLDFGSSAFTGNARWLDIGVRTNGGSAFTSLSPRQLIAPTPLALYAANSGSAGVAMSAVTASSVAASNIVGTVQLDHLPISVMTNYQNGVNLGGTFTGSLSNSAISAPQSLGAFSQLSFARNQKPIMSANFMYYMYYNGTNWFKGLLDTNAYSKGIPCLSLTNALFNRPYWTGSIYGDTTEYFVLSAATNAIKTGLAALGYKWIDIGDGWATSATGVMPRTNGVLQADPSKFPHGMPWLFNTLHAMGLKGILWTTLTPRTAVWQLGSGTNLVTDANTFASWGVDCIRFDFDSAWMGPSTNDVMKQVAVETFLRALQATNANIVTFMHNNLAHNPDRPVEVGFWTKYQPWIGETLSHWQTTDSGNLIPDSSPWSTTVHWLDVASQWSGQLRRGHSGAPIPVQSYFLLPWDPNYFGYNNGTLFVSEMALFHSPMCFADNLVAFGGVVEEYGIPPAKLADFQTNAYVIAINQDDACNPPNKQFTNGTVEVWIEPLGENRLWPSGSQALLVVNRGYATNVTATSINLPLTALGFPANGNAARFTDIWNHTNQVVTGSFTFDSPTNSASFWLVSPENTIPPSNAPDPGALSPGTQGLSTNITVSLPGGGNATLCFTNGILRAVQ